MYVNSPLRALSFSRFIFWDSKVWGSTFPAIATPSTLLRYHALYFVLVFSLVKKTRIINSYLMNLSGISRIIHTEVIMLSATTGWIQFLFELFFYGKLDEFVFVFNLFVSALRRINNNLPRSKNQETCKYTSNLINTNRLVACSSGYTIIACKVEIYFSFFTWHCYWLKQNYQFWTVKHISFESVLDF